MGVPRMLCGLACVALVALSSGCRSGEPTAAREPQPTPQELFELAQESVARGRIALEAGELEEARAAFEAAIARNPGMSDAHLAIGDLHRVEGDLPSAADAYGQAAMLSPRSFDAHYKHGLVLHLLDRLGESVRAYLSALRVTPGDFDANLNLATAYLQLGEPEQGIAFAERAVAVRPDSGPARVNLGAIYAAVGRHRDAAMSFLAATEFMEPTAALLLSLAESQAASGDQRAASFTLERLVDREPSAVAWERLGAARFRMREYGSALSAFRAALQIDPRHAPALNGLAVSRLNDYLWSGKMNLQALADAKEAMRESLRVEPRQPRIIELLTRFG